MSDVSKTAVFAAVAVVLLIAAIFAVPTYHPPKELTELGPFYPEFTDATKAGALEVIEYNETTGEPERFKVELKDGIYVIPSHEGYPADAADRLVNTAALAVGLKKDVFRSSREKDHEELGVIGPKEAGGAGKGRGKRVTLWDAGEPPNVLADYIFGKEAGRGKRFVRLPNDKRTYTVRVEGEITAKFEDWIETDLLKISQYTIRKIELDRYTLEFSRPDPFSRARISILNSTQNTLARPTSSDPWTLDDLKETEEVKTDTVTDVLSALDDLKIVDVRRKPAGMTRNLQLSGEINLQGRLTPQMLEAVQSLSQKGYYFVTIKETDANGKPVRDEKGEVKTITQLLSEKGQLTISCDDGIVYTLRFGESRVTVGSGSEKKEEKPEEIGVEEQRYLFVTARFEETALGDPLKVPEAPPGFIPDGIKKEGDKEKPEQEETPEVKKYREDLADYAQNAMDRQKKIEEGKKRGKMLTDRFADWYYLISGDLFNKLQVDRAKLVKPKEKETEEDPK